MKYTVYKTTNNINGKVYIGKHQTDNLDDNYLGSGKMLQRAIKKHGIENFTKEILFVFDNEQEMNAKEAELVSLEFCSEDTNYNLCPGGQGGWGYNNTKEGQKLREHSYQNWSSAGIKGFQEKVKTDLVFREKLSNNMSNVNVDLLKRRKSGELEWPFKGKTHSDETKNKMSEIASKHQQGAGNSQYGSMWITNGIDSSKIKKSDIIPEGWYKGRKQKVKHVEPSGDDICFTSRLR